MCILHIFAAKHKKLCNLHIFLDFSYAPAAAEMPAELFMESVLDFPVAIERERKQVHPDGWVFYDIPCMDSRP